MCILPEDVAAMLALLKIARIASGHAKADNWVDLAGYAACGGEIEGGEEMNGDLKPCPFCGGEAVLHACAELENETARVVYSGKTGGALHNL